MADQRVLVIVEDSEEDYYAASRILKSHNFAHEVVHFKDGDEAIEYLSGEKNSKIPGLILLDLNLPVLDGREVLQILRFQDETRTVPIVITTTSSNPVDVAYCYKLGANGYFVKPVDFSHLEKAIMTITDYWFSIMMSPPR